MKKLHAFIIVAAILICSCKKDNDLRRSIFLSDPGDYSLPAYSEWGYNTFGAYIDREIFVSNNDAVPAKFVCAADTASFIIDGTYNNFLQRNETGYYSAYRYPRMIMTFKFSGFSVETYSGLVVLNDTVFDLSMPENKLSITIDSINYTPVVLSGQVYFKRAQLLIVDKIEVQTILSGNFEMKILLDNMPLTISEGRFDMGINNYNFYRY
jgi:hypothetical protein